jgi:hypothetical protein
MKYNRTVEFIDGCLEDFYKVIYPNGIYKLIYITHETKKTTLVEFYDSSGWLRTYTEHRK